MVLERGALRILINLGDAAWAPELAGEVLFATSPDAVGDPVVLPADSAAVVRLVG